jgi:hypothetical protein
MLSVGIPGRPNDIEGKRDADNVLSALEVVVLISASLIPDDAPARRGGGGGFRVAEGSKAK